MELRLIADVEGNQYYSAVIERAANFAIPFGPMMYPCLLYSHIQDFDWDEMEAICLALIRSGCRHVMTAGCDATRWEGSVDMAWVHESLDYSEAVLDSHHVMTSGWEDYPFADVILHFVLATSFDYHWFHKFLVLHIGDSPQRAVVDEAVRREAMHEVDWG